MPLPNFRKLTSTELEDYFAGVQAELERRQGLQTLEKLAMAVGTGPITINGVAFTQQESAIVRMALIEKRQNAEAAAKLDLASVSEETTDGGEA